MCIRDSSLFSVSALADVAPVAVRMATPTVWVGQRATLYVELRAPGSFVGTASFELPRIPGTLLMRIGNPVVSSQDIEGASWFVQTHELSLIHIYCSRQRVIPRSRKTC